MHIGLFVKDFAIGKKFSKDGLPTGLNFTLKIMRNN